MRSKRLWIGIIVAAMIVSIVCVTVYSTTPRLTDAIKSIGYGWAKGGTADALLSISDRYDKSEATVYNREDFSILALGSQGIVGYRGAFPPRDMYSFNRHFPITNLTENSNGLLYTMYTVQDEEGTLYTLICFFEELLSHKYAPSEDSERWLLSGQVFTIYKTLSRADFSSIQLGDTYEDVVAIDPSANQTRPYYIEDSYVTYGGKTTFFPAKMEYQTTHYLTDGILTITYSREDKLEEFYISNIAFNETFEVVGLNDIPVSLTINQEDYPDR